MTDHKSLRLDLLGSVARGKSRHRPRNDPALYGGQWPFFQTGDVKAAELYLRKFTQTYSELGLAQSKLWPAGTLCITIAANIADTAILGIPGCFPDSVVGFIADPAKADTRFIKYYIDTIKKGMQNASRGTTQDNLSVDKLLTFDFLVPPAIQQRRIAAILSAYDDLIENNTRRIAILGEMARRIYEEWFVRFRFPGHEQTRMVESALGPVPEGWELASLGAVAENHDRFRRPLSKMEREDFRGPYPYYGAAKIFDYVREYLFDGQYLLLAEDGSVETPDGYPVLQLTDGKFWANNHTHILRGSQHASTEFLYLRLERQPIRGYITGAAQPKLTQAAINRIPIVLPPKNIMREFDALVHPFFQLRATLVRSIANLRTTRDLLLPKLISGELDVSDLPEPQGVAA
ncbi:restriction endonuclease subunit S [Thiomonas sp.]